MILVDIPLRLGLGLNNRDGWRAAHRRSKAEKQSIAWALIGKPKPATPCVIRITRVAPSAGPDDDNLAGACKATRDAVAAWLGIDDKRTDLVRYETAHARGPWGVRIEVVA